MSTIQQRVADALAAITVSEGEDVIASQTVRDIATTVDGRVHMTVALRPADDPSLVRDVRQAVESVHGVTAVTIDVRHENGPAGTVSRPAPANARNPLPVMDGRPAAARPGVPPPVAYPHLGSIIAVSSGKGGVGKSTVAVNLAVALARRGLRVGLMDADVYGPNVPRMMGVNSPPPVRNEKIIPLEAHGVRLMSLGFLIEREQPAIWRGPIVMKIVSQFLRDVDWGTLDCFLVDMPPGTGDAQLSLVQATNVAGALIVTTPQLVATGDALRGARMFERVNVPVLGIVENMSWLECRHCGKPTAVFGSGGGEELARELGLELLAQIPLHPPVTAGGDTGVPIVVGDPSSPAARALEKLAETLHARVGSRRE